MRYTRKAWDRRFQLGMFTGLIDDFTVHMVSRRPWLPSGVTIGDLANEYAGALGSAFGRITAPTLVVGGARDRFYGADLLTMPAAGIPNAELVLVPESGTASAAGPDGAGGDSPVPARRARWFAR
jgi:pimeloyl-ACP methyl ester carboxylesterase